MQRRYSRRQSYRFWFLLPQSSSFINDQKCFVCHVCKKQLTGKYYKVKGSGKDEYLFTCIDDYNQSYGASCALCSKIIEGKGIVIEGLGSVIHAECCKCQSCDQIIKRKTQNIIQLELSYSGKMIYLYVLRVLMYKLCFI